MLFAFFIFPIAVAAAVDYSCMSTSESPSATLLHATWGRFILYDFIDNNLLDASILYGPTQAIASQLTSSGGKMLLTDSGRLPRLCNNSIVPKLYTYSPDEAPCCGAAICNESPEMRAIYILLLTKHNDYVDYLREYNNWNTGHGPHLMQLAREYVTTIIRSTCPDCSLNATGVYNPLTTEVLQDLMAVLSQADADCDCGVTTCVKSSSACGILAATAEEPLMTIDWGLNISSTNSTVLSDSLNCTYITSVTGATFTLSEDTRTIEYYTNYIDTGGDSLIGCLLSERHGPLEEDVIGAVGHATMLRYLNVSQPPWINNSTVRGIITSLYNGMCAAPATESAVVVSTTSCPNTCNDGVEKGSLIFFVIVIAALAAVSGGFVIYEVTRVRTQ